ncbi:DUF3105 domain-containing protein [Lipingzhangella sp. LS1_29]|uniref:DUF3105 domain-containing protein n=1 Tax=Lipingzhangella rawalii TaxID=2055835 RepID=A0ABU2H5Q1_9ACTN|nr:DUF3105 domain-containing protein [Lipingzhangella rawalii]MDS1270637.1 DUF3105 domain-containing protein [Lipingzhangella rawalii]
MGQSAAQRRRQKSAEMKQRRIREAQRRKAIRTGGLTAVGVLAAGFLGFAGYMAYDQRTISGLETYSGLDRTHVPEPPDYQMSPPAGGQHHEQWQNCGVYTQPITDMHAVHSLEHGAVWITHSPDLPREEVQTLHTYYTPGDYILISPYTGDMPDDSDIVLSAWGAQVAVDDPEDERIEKFLRRFEQSNDVPEPGAPCSGMIDETAPQLEAQGQDTGVDLGEYALDGDDADADSADDEDDEGEDEDD